MPIKKKRIRTLDRYARLLPATSDIVIGVLAPEAEALQRVGFSQSVANGETVLPARVGPISEYNAEGKFIIHRDQQMEEVSRVIEWTWTECHGKERIERTEWRDLPYKRYPRTFIPPPSIELTLTTDTSGRRVVRSPLISNWKDHKNALLHTVNLILELFGECTFFDSKLNNFITAPIKRLNWHVLPPGERPFEQLKTQLQYVLSKAKDGTGAYAEYRLDAVNKYKPDFAAVGMGGFAGYVILGFQKKKLYILESILYGNATYVLGEEWEALSKRSKAEILDAKLHKARLIHHRGWGVDIARLLNPKDNVHLFDNQK